MSQYGQISQQIEMSSDSHHHNQNGQHQKFHNNYEQVQSQSKLQRQEQHKQQAQKTPHLAKRQKKDQFLKLALPTQEKIMPQSPRNGSASKQKKIKMIARAVDKDYQSPIKSTNLLIYDLEQNDHEKIVQIKKIESTEHYLKNTYVEQNEDKDVIDKLQEEDDENQPKILIRATKNIKQQKERTKAAFNQIIQNNSSLNLFQRPTTAYREDKQSFFNESLTKKSILEKHNAQLQKGIFFADDEHNQEFNVPAIQKTPSRDSGLQITNLNTLEQSSSRNIIGYPSFSTISTKSRSKLQSLKPYKNNQSRPSSQINLFYKQNQKQIKLENVQKIVTVDLFGSVIIRSEDIDNVQQFVTSTVPYSKRLQCILKRNKSTCKRFFLDYDLYTKDGKFLLSCKKMGFKLFSTYHISLANDDYDQKSSFFLGKVQGNFTGSIFNFSSSKLNEKGQKQLVGTIHYKDQWKCCKQMFRTLQIYLKNQDYRYNQLQGYSSQNPKNLKDLYEMPKNKKKRIRKLVSKQPIYNERHKVYTLNLHGKAKMSSIKNMVILNEKRLAEQTLLLAKQSHDQFQLDICYPFSPMVALGLVISGFDFKLVSQ